MEQVKRPKKPLMFYYTIVLIILILFNIIAMPYIKEKQIKDVDYGTFISMTEQTLYSCCVSGGRWLQPAPLGWNRYKQVLP